MPSYVQSELKGLTRSKARFIIASFGSALVEFEFWIGSISILVYYSKTMSLFWCLFVVVIKLAAAQYGKWNEQLTKL